MATNKHILLGVNIDHVATLRQARKTHYPEPIYAAQEAEMGGADGITLHLREDKRHIQERDVSMLRDFIETRMNLEMAVTDEMLTTADSVRPVHCCLVPESREELTTEGGLDVVGNEDRIERACSRLSDLGSQVSLFIDPTQEQIDAAVRCHAPAIELHTGLYADAANEETRANELKKIKDAASYAFSKGLIVNAGHGLHYHNVIDIAAIPEINELNIGHSIVARAVFVGMREAVRQMKELMNQARLYALHNH